MLVLNGCAYPGRFHPSQFATVNPKIQVIESLGAANLHAVQVRHSSSDHKNPALFIPDARVNEGLGVKGVGTIPVTLLGNKWLITLNNGLRGGSYVRPNVRFNSQDRHQVVGLIDNLETQTNLAKARFVWPDTLAYSNRNDIHPLPHRDGLNVRLLESRFGRLSRLISLPANNGKGQNNGPDCYALRPCQEYVPAWRLGCAFAVLFCAIAVLRWRNGGWQGKFCGVSFLILTGALILTGHQYYCDDQPNHPSEDCQPLQHNEKNVSHKHLTYTVYL